MGATLSAVSAAATTGPIVLVGTMGAGKSTVGALLAERLGVPFVDADAEIVRRAGQPIANIFATFGEPAFRDLEAQVIADLLARPGVLSLGGGAVTTAATRHLVRAQRVVWLRVSDDEGLRRVSGTDRPMLASADPAARYRDLAAARAPLYAEVAAVTVDADPDAATVVASILAALGAGVRASHDEGPSHPTPPPSAQEDMA